MLQGPAVGFHYIILDSLAEDYTNFNTLFIEFPFCLTDRTGDSFAICQVFSIVPMLLLLLAGLVVKVGQMLQVKNRFWYFPHWPVLDLYLPVAAHERRAEPAGLVRPDLCLQHPAAHAGFPL